jgi:hypothetical protein
MKPVKTSRVVEQAAGRMNDMFGDVVFDLDGLTHNLNNTTGELILSMPIVTISLAETASELRQLGLDDGEVDSLTEDFYRSIQIKVASKILAQRMR